MPNRETLPPGSPTPNVAEPGGTLPVMTAEGMVKSYGAVRALTAGDLQIRAGEVVALLGSNGSGKSTLGKILTGVTRPDAGEIRFDGKVVRFSAPSDARRLGVTAVYQELSLVPDLTVAENVWLGHEPIRAGGLDRAVMRRETQRLLELFEGTFSVPVEPFSIVRVLPPGERQIVEILKALSQGPRVLILDEATASLDGRQVARLFELVRRWRDEGMALAFVSHRMDEIFEISDRAVVLRNGETVGAVRMAEAVEEVLVALMTGTSTPVVPLAGAGAVDATGAGGPLAGQPEAGRVVLATRGLSAGRLKPLAMELRQGELVGIGGLQGQGQVDLLLALFGAIPHQGEVVRDGVVVRLRGPRAAMRLGLAYVPGDRGAEGLLPIRPILENLQLPSWARYGWPLRMAAARSDAADMVHELGIKLASLDEPVANLSGGNAQKVVIGKWLLRDPAVLLLNDPTKGVDVGAKAEFYKLLHELQARGTAILFYSSDDDELLGLCQRILVLHDGQVAAELRGEDQTRTKLVAAAMGGRSQPVDSAWSTGA